MPIETINPATGIRIHSYSEMSDSEVNKIIDATELAFQNWREYNFEKRAVSMRKIANLLQQKKQEYALLMAQEMGKPLKQGEAEIEKCALVCNHYAERASTYLESTMIPTEMRKSYVSYQPLGVIFAIMPWNFPFWQVFRFAAPTLMAGNAALLKHAPISTGTALAIEQLFQEAGCLENLFRTLIISNETAKKVIQHEKVAAVTLTGSPQAGKIVATEASQALKKSVLELGGCDPYLILEDADLELAADECVKSRMLNSGQSCIAAKRLIVIQTIHAEFLALIKEKVQKYKMGNPLDENIQCGPLAREDLRDKVHEQVQKSLEKGAELVLGGKLPSQAGFYYPPTILINVKKGMPAYHEEIFGPVITLISAKDENEAIEIANSTSYGLGAGIFTENIERGERLAREKIQAGSCAVNTFIASDPRLPFGGIKDSGYGRELSEEGIRSFVNVKTINIK